MKEKRNIRAIGKTMKKDDAKKWVKRYQKKNPDATFGWLFGDDIIEKILSYGADGIWFFKGIDDSGNEKLVMYPADSDGNILKNDLSAAKSLGAAAGSEPDPANDSRTAPPLDPQLS